MRRLTTSTAIAWALLAGLLAGCEGRGLEQQERALNVWGSGSRNLNLPDETGSGQNARPGTRRDYAGDDAGLR